MAGKGRMYAPFRSAPWGDSTINPLRAGNSATLSSRDFRGPFRGFLWRLGWHGPGRIAETKRQLLRTPEKWEVNSSGEPDDR